MERQRYVLTLCFLALSACPLGPDKKTYDPVWIRASFTPPGVEGAPSARVDNEPEEFIGSRCPARSVLLDNWHSNGGSLTIKNNCVSTQEYYLCVSKGSDPQELQQCATDPLETPFAQLRWQVLSPGPYGNWYESTRLVTVHVFYCSHQQRLVGPPLKCE